MSASAQRARAAMAAQGQTQGQNQGQTQGQAGHQPAGAQSEVQRKKLTNRLLVAVREEIAAHERLAELLAAQEAHVVKPSEGTFGLATEALEKELERIPFRKAQRDRVLKDLGRALGVEAVTLTLRSAAERLGTAGQPLLIERGRLIEVAERVQKANKRVAALVRLHREVTREILNTVLGDGSGREPLDGGTLIDAEV